MRLRHKKTALGVTWLSAVLAAGLIGQATWSSAWFMLVGVVLVPLAVMWLLWAPPPETISESIQNARR